MTVPSPATVRQAAALVALEGVAGLVAAVAFVVRGLGGADQSTVSGFGNAAWFADLRRRHSRRRAGRCGPAGGGAAALPSSRSCSCCPSPGTWAVGSHQWLYGIAVAAVALITLGLLFSPSALQWLGTQDSARADNSGPDTR